MTSISSVTVMCILPVCTQGARRPSGPEGEYHLHSREDRFSLPTPARYHPASARSTPRISPPEGGETAPETLDWGVLGSAASPGDYLKPAQHQRRKKLLNAFICLHTHEKVDRAGLARWWCSTGKRISFLCVCVCRFANLMARSQNKVHLRVAFRKVVQDARQPVEIKWWTCKLFF